MALISNLIILDLRRDVFRFSSIIRKGFQIPPSLTLCLIPHIGQEIRL